MIFKRAQSAYGDTPEPVTPFQKAAREWDDRIGNARVQAKNWRLVAFGNLILSAVMAAGLLWQSLQSRITPYIIEVNKLGEVRTVGPAVQPYQPSDAQIAYQLAGFIRLVRAVSVDPIVLRQNWLDAYDFVTDKAARTLNDYAGKNDPFADIGRRSVSVEITSVVRASDQSFQIKWIERHFANGAFDRLERHTAILTIVVQQPTDEATLRKNPLRLYIHGINWSHDLDRGDYE